MAADFIKHYRLDPGLIDGNHCVNALIHAMKQGLEQTGNIPMNPSYLSLDIQPTRDIPCCIIDAGGTNLRVGSAMFSADGKCTVSNIFKTPMLGLEYPLTCHDFYEKLAEKVYCSGHTERIGFCFSYNVEHNRSLDGILQSWCKEIRIPEAVGMPVGQSLRNAIGPNCEKVHVVNDSVAALLGGHYRNKDVTVGVILGTGINICYSEYCKNILKVPKDLLSDSMIISTEIGEFQGIPKTVFDEAVIAESDEPNMAHAEKQCSGAYLGDLISKAWIQAAEEGILNPVFCSSVTLPQISNYLEGTEATLPDCPAAKKITWTMICRAAKIAAILTAGVVLFRHSAGEVCTMVIEGSQFDKLTGFRDAYTSELDTLLTPHRVSYKIVQSENNCLVGAALSAFAKPM